MERVDVDVDLDILQSAWPEVDVGQVDLAVPGIHDLEDQAGFLQERLVRFSVDSFGEDEKVEAGLARGFVEVLHGLLEVTYDAAGREGLLVDLFAEFGR